MKALRTVWFAFALLLTMLGSAMPQADAQDIDAEATISALQTQVAELTTPESDASQSTITSETTPTEVPSDESSQTDRGAVNVEIILDVSGSMGQVIDTGETRMEAAKRVLNEVVAAIPNEPDVNVGLRIYGHEGDNSESGRQVSCQSSDLIVPITGVDRAAIAQQIAPLVPTGWTPIGLSLERSEADFPVSGTKSTNAVVLVTDGLETCDGDPTAAAARLASGGKGIVTHVIGFALTPEEQQILQNITEASGGMLLSAANANELSAALFTVLEELEIVVGQGYMGGNAFSLIPAGIPGQIDIVAFGAPDPSSGSVPFVVRNNTGTDVYDVRVSATVKDPDGRVLAAGDDQGIRPFHIQPGTLGIGHIYFDGIILPADATYEFRVESSSPGKLRYKRTRDLEVAEASIFEDRIVGQIENVQDGDIKGIIGVAVTCFDLSGVPLRDYWDFVETNQLSPGQLVPFQTTLYGVLAQGCPAFLIAANGQCDSCTPIAIQADTPRAASSPAAPANPGGSSQDAPADAREEAMLAQTPLPGYIDVASRTFRFTGGGLANVAFVSYSLLEFETVNLADASLEETASRYLAMRESPLSNLLPAPPPSLGDRAIAFTADGDDPNFVVKVAIMAVRDGPRIHFLIGSQLNQSPIPIMEEVALQGLLPVEEPLPGELTVTGLNSGGLWDTIPRPEDLPEGFSVDDELVPKMFGPFAKSPMSTAPSASPSPTGDPEEIA